MGYTHVELMPQDGASPGCPRGLSGHGVLCTHQPFRTPDDFMYFMDYMHSQGIGVILDWVPAHFLRDAWGMAQFDGTCVYGAQGSEKRLTPPLGNADI